MWQSTVIDIEPGTQYGRRTDAAQINTTLAIGNNTGGDLTFPLILATTDPEETDPSHRSLKVMGKPTALGDDVRDAEWDTLEAAIVAQGVAQGYSEERMRVYVEALKKDVTRAYKSEPVTVPNGAEYFVRSYQRRLLPRRDSGVYEFRGLFPLPQFALTTGGSISVIVNLPRSTNRFGVELLDWTRNYGPQAFGKDPGLPQIAGRYVVSWFWRNDPELYVTYTYPGQP